MRTRTAGRAAGAVLLALGLAMLGSAVTAPAASGSQALTLDPDHGTPGTSVSVGNALDDCRDAESSPQSQKPPQQTEPQKAPEPQKPPESPTLNVRGAPGAPATIVTTVTWTGPSPRPTSQDGVATTIVVPDALTPGTYTVTLECRNSAQEIPVEAGPATFTVTGPTTTTTPSITGHGGSSTSAPTAITRTPPTLRLSAASAQPGDAVTATGRSFTELCAPRRMNLMVNGDQVTPIRTSGDAQAPSVAFAVPDLPPGVVRVRLSCSDGTTAFAALRVTAPDPPTSSTAAAPASTAAGGGAPTTGGAPPTGGTAPSTAGSPPTDTTDVTTVSAVTTRSDFVRSVPTPDELDWTLPAVLTSVVLAGFLFWALGFPSEPFNKTLEEKHEQIRGWFLARGGLGPAQARGREAASEAPTESSAEVPPPDAPNPTRRRILDGWIGFPLWCVLAAVLLSLVEPGTSFAPSAWMPVPPLTVGFLIAVPATTLIYALPAEMYLRGIGGGGAVLRFVPGAVVFAAACVLLSRWIGLEPGYVYGLFAFYAAATTSEVRHSPAGGRAVLLGSLWLLVVAVTAWFTWPLVIPAASGPDPGYWTLVTDAALVAIFVLGVQTLVFGLIPIEFLDGRKLKRWSLPVWAVVWAGSLALFVHVLLAKFVKAVRDPDVAVAAAAAFLLFGALSAGFWLAARFGSAQAFDADGRPEPQHRRHRVAAGPPRTRLALGIALLVVLVAVPLTVLVTGRLWSGEADAGVAIYPATVDVDGLRVRPEASLVRPEVAELPRGTPVQVRCVVTAADGGWYELLTPNQRNFVSGIGISFPDASRPPPC
jgi:hypothetical protein